jgi:hypothetical protein
VDRTVTVDGCELAALKDVAAMKMTAIVQRATKRDSVKCNDGYDVSFVACSCGPDSTSCDRVPDAGSE